MALFDNNQVKCSHIWYNLIVMLLRNLANIITSSRIVGAFILIFFDILSKPFRIIYAWCGISDVLDGFIARKLKTTSELGSRLDSFSDLLFYSLMLYKIWPYLLKELPTYVIYLIYFVMFIRLLCYIYVGYKTKALEARHTIFNKATGLLLFFLPYTINTGYMFIYSLVIIFVAYVSSFEEVIHIFKGE